MVVLPCDVLAPAPVPLLPMVSPVVAQTALESAPFADADMQTTKELRAGPAAECTP
ncbi:MAG: hypothetical protein ACLP62_01225 [Acidimicrobiales bacterium]